MHLKSPIPILRAFDEAKAKEFYVGFLGFKMDWEHRFGDNYPLYMQVSRDLRIIHLSERHGDACPGSSMRIETAGLDDFCATLRANDYKNSKPGHPLDTSWGTKEIYVTDPFGNKVIFYERKN
jgi:catechol 2,3-dioxygenase-like lactoylglutathione lyase family enzyme